MIENLKPELICRPHIFFNDLLDRSDRLFSFDGFLNNSVHFVQIYPSLTDKIIEANHIFVPNLHSKNIRVHVFGLRWIKYWKFKSVIKISNRSTCPMNVCLLIITFSNLPSDKNVVRFKLLVFENTLFCAPNNHSEFILIPRWRGYFYNWFYKPFFLLY